MTNKHDPDATEVQLGEVFAQSRQNAEQLAALGNKLDAVVIEFRRAIEQTSERAERMFEQVRRAASPNMGNIWMGIGVAISFIALLGTAFGYGINREIGRLDVGFDKLDSKLSEQIKLNREDIHRLEQRQYDRLIDELKNPRAKPNP